MDGCMDARLGIFACMSVCMYVSVCMHIRIQKCIYIHTIVCRIVHTHIPMDGVREESNVRSSRSHTVFTVQLPVTTADGAGLVCAKESG